jgi:hypothetical protein
MCAGRLSRKRLPSRNKGRRREGGTCRRGRRQQGVRGTPACQQQGTCEADQKLLAEQQRINDERANLRRFDFQEAVEAQAKEEVLAQQRAAAAKEQQKRLEQLLESQNKIARAQAAIPGTLPSGAVPQAPRDFSQSITSILAPAQAARETLAGIEKQIDAITVGMQAAKLRSEDYDKILRDLGATFGALQRQANLVESFRQQEQATGRLLAELTKEQSTLEAMNVLYARTQVYDEAQVRVILDQTNKVKGLTTAFNAQNETFSQIKAAAQAAGIDINNLAASETRITEAALKGQRGPEDGERCDRQGQRVYLPRAAALRVAEPFLPDQRRVHAACQRHVDHADAQPARRADFPAIPKADR